MSKRKQTNIEKNYLEEIFEELDYISPEERAIGNIEQLPIEDLDILPISRRKSIRYEEISD